MSGGGWQSWGRGSLGAVTLLALGWNAGSSLLVYPHSLAYFNEGAGGPGNGWRHMAGSNLDWGQDLLYVRKWMRTRDLQLENVRVVTCCPANSSRWVSPVHSDGTYVLWEVVSVREFSESPKQWEYPVCNGHVMERVTYTMWAFDLGFHFGSPYL